MGKNTIKNFLLVSGAYYLSRWVEPPMVLAFAPLTNHLTFTGDFEGAVVMPMVLGIPSALILALTGSVVAWLVDSEHPIVWSLVPAILYATFSALGHHWVRPPEVVDRIAQILQALFPAVACVVAAWLFSARRGRLAVRQTVLI